MVIDFGSVVLGYILGIFLIYVGYMLGLGIKTYKKCKCNKKPKEMEFGKKGGCL